MTLSKSDYMLYLRHPAWLWVKKNAPDKLPPIDDSTQALFDAGHEFESYAESLFPEGVTLGFSGFDEYASLPERTRQAIDSGARVLFQSRFVWDDYTCICDVVEIVDDSVVDLYEIKASTSAKKEHQFDLAFQVAVLEGAGFEVRNVSVIHVNNQYVRNGDIKADKITQITDVTELVGAHHGVTLENMAQALSVANQPTIPDPDPKLAKLGSRPDWLKIYENMFPPEPKVWPDDLKPEIDHGQIQQFLNQLKYPLYFLDYETMSALIPYFDGHSPYQQVPMQYSLHILTKPDAEIEHKEFLHRDNSNPAEPLVKSLIQDIGSSGSVIVWNEGFEKSCNTKLGDMLPEYKSQMEAINDRVVDLMIPFKAKWYLDPRFEGSASIKKVLPVLCPELSYGELGIQEGSSAQRLWMEAIIDGKHADEKQQIIDDLLEYCKLDTLAMVEIFYKLRNL